jgi:putative two-component system response regulator
MTEKPKRILVADDEDSNRLLFKTMLTRLGYEVIEAPNGKIAFDKAKELSPELILMDVRMPVMDGLEATRLLKADPRAKLIPVVIISSMSDVKDRVLALDAGADDFMSKPVDRIELQARVRSLVKMKEYNDYMLGYQKQLETEVAHRTVQLKQALDRNKLASLDTIFRLSQAAEYKDEDTGAHIVRIGFYAAAIARKMGFNPNDSEALLYAAPMHDVGKIGIPDKILLKPAKLEPDEWDTMKQHTTIGGKILQGSDFDVIQMAEVVALTHHEKWDGTGYPRGLQGENIPKVGRIAAIADVFDALTTRRPYKDAFPYDKALTIIQEMAPVHFDPQVTSAFFEIVDQILEIRKSNEDAKVRATMLRRAMVSN